MIIGTIIESRSIPLGVVKAHYAKFPAKRLISTSDYMDAAFLLKEKGLATVYESESEMGQTDEILVKRARCNFAIKLIKSIEEITPQTLRSKATTFIQSMGLDPEQYFKIRSKQNVADAKTLAPEFKKQKEISQRSSSKRTLRRRSSNESQQGSADSPKVTVDASVIVNQRGQMSASASASVPASASSRKRGRRTRDSSPSPGSGSQMRHRQDTQDDDTQASTQEFDQNTSGRNTIPETDEDWE